MTEALLSWSWAIPLLPLMAFLAGIAVQRRPALAATVNLAAAAAAAVWAVLVGIRFVQDGAATALVAQATWLPLDGDLAVRFGILLDPISVMMLVVVAVIHLLVQVYSLGYLREDATRGRFFPLLSLFASAMLGLVLAGNLAQLFVCWELVGLSSYLLIGFWHERPAAIAAAKKAFIITRLADAFFLVGLILVGLAAGSFDLATLLSPIGAQRVQAASFLGVDLLTLGTALIFVGAWGKSAMFPLHVWLPDAMEGPTPVSSIIHSATMVVAGVFLVARLFPLMALSPLTLGLAEATGAFTALFAAVIACTQRDVKRILAYSTLSQLGLMMAALGTAGPADGAGYSAAMFHVFSHAWFKCLLFLAAGVLIHAAHANDVVAMGGLRRRLPLTWAVTGLACLAIAGVPPLSGFFSKDAILVAAWSDGHHVTAVVGLLTGLLTAFYMFRLFFLAFHGEWRGDAHALEHVHEDRVMLAPMLVLALPTVAAGWLAQGWFAQHALPGGIRATIGHHAAWIPWTAGALAIAGCLGAWLRYGRGAVPGPVRGVVKLAYDRFHIDVAWLWLARTAMIGGVARAARWCDDAVVDGAVLGTATGAQSLGGGLRRFQDGRLHRYLFAMATALVLAITAERWWLP